MSLDDLVTAIMGGAVAAVATDTVFGLAARLEDTVAISALFAIKQRPPTVALPVMVASVEDAERLGGTFSPRARSLAAGFWPGALTLVVPAPTELAQRVGGRDSLGFRIPAAPGLLALLERTGPLAVTSCNLHGQPPATTADAARAVLGTELILDGPAVGGVPSTVVEVRRGSLKVLREGALEIASIEAHPWP